MLRQAADLARRSAGAFQRGEMLQVPVFSAAARAMSAQAAPQTPPLAKGSLLNDVTIGRVMREKVVAMPDSNLTFELQEEAGGVTANLFTVKVSDKVLVAIEKMAGANVGSVVVIKGDVEPGNLKQENVAGVITERDYVRKVAVLGKSSKEMTCSALMTGTRELHTLTPDDNVLKAMQIMEDKNIRHIPVFDSGRLLGMLSVKDIISTIMSEHDTEVACMSDYINVSY